jgi:hypothetical protein
MARRIVLVLLPDSDTPSSELRGFLEQMPLESFDNSSFSSSLSSLGIDLHIPSPANSLPKTSWLTRPENWHLLGPQGSFEDLSTIELSLLQVSFPLSFLTGSCGDSCYKFSKILKLVMNIFSLAA